MRFLIIPLLALAACAPAQPTDVGYGAPSPSRACFIPDQVRNFNARDTGHMYVRDLRDNVFDVQISGACFELETANSMAITPYGGGGGRVCEGDSVRIQVVGSRPRTPCMARIGKQMTADELAALPSSYRP